LRADTISSCLLCAPTFLHGAGPSAAETAQLFWIVLAAMLIVVLPVLVLTPIIAWRYRLRGTAVYTPKWAFSWPIEIIVWGIPLLIVLSLSVVVWSATHRLDPYRPIGAAQPPLDVEVVGMDWKWLFLYPEARIASINVVVVPVGRPLRLHLTSATVMQSFMVPELGGQIYAMAGMTTQLNLLATHSGAFAGQNTQFNGPGFPKQRFRVLAVSTAAFDRFVARAKAAPRLDPLRYAILARQSTFEQPRLFSNVSPDLFRTILWQGNHSSGASR
jgi:cytochrome o ubiquinol oxidase subunit 2